MNNQVTNILLVGVGGQGILVASEIISEALMLAGFDVKKSEVHGMAQRGGSVVSHVRYGEKVFSPIITEGEADIMLGFELLETYRYLPLMKQNGRAVVNNLKINPADSCHRPGNLSCRDSGENKKTLSRQHSDGWPCPCKTGGKRQNGKYRPDRGTVPTLGY